MENYITGIIAIVSFVISNILNAYSEKVRFKRTRFIEKEKEANKIETELALKRFNQKNQDIKEIYLFLLKMRKYHNLFCNHESEFADREDSKNFAPLSLWTDFREMIEDKELFLEDEIIEKLYNLHGFLYNGNNLAVYPEDTREKSLEGYCESVVEEIQKVMDYLKIKIQS